MNIFFLKYFPITAGIASQNCQWIFILFSSLVIPLNGQTPSLERISSDLGLSQNLVNCLIQDKKGFLWAGTNDGLNRFDGYRFKVYRNDPFDSLSLGDNRIFCMTEDKKGLLWIGTLAGLNLYDPTTGLFHKNPFKNTIGDKPISALLEDWDGTIWVIADGKNIFRITAEDNGVFKVVQTKTVFQNKNQVATSLIQIGQVGENRYWLSSERQNQIFEFDYVRDAEKMVYHEGFLNLPGDWQKTLSDTTFYDKRLGLGVGKDVWLGLGKKLVKFDGQTRQLSYFDFEGKGDYIPAASGVGRAINLTGLDDHLVLYASYLQYVLIDVQQYRINNDDFKKNPLLTAGTTCGVQDEGGIIWMGTLGTGLLKSDNKSKRFASKTNRSSLNLLGGESIRSIFEASNGLVFYSYAAGDYPVNLYVTDGNTFKSVPGISREVFAFFEDNDKQIWVGGDGLVRLSINQSGGLEVGKPGYLYPEKAYALTQERDNKNKICDIIAADDGGLWVGTPTEICHFDKNKQTFSCHSFHAPLPYASPNYSSLHQDKDGFIWIGSPFGLFKFDPKNKSFESYTTDVNNPHSLSQNIINCIEPDFRAPERYLWIGTAGGGLNLFDKQTKTFEHFTEKDGLPNMTVYSTLFDETGNLWMSTNKGISVFNPADKSFLNFDVKDGLQDNEFNGRAYCKGKSGKFYFGGINGMNVFRPSEILKSNPHVPKIVLTDFKLSNRSVTVRDEDSPLKNDIAYAKEIVLNYDQKSFSFEFSALDFTESSKNRYAIMMEGFDPDWQYIGTTRSATYTNLDPGSYTFRVKGSNNDGVWNEEGVSVKVVILPPWWRTWWAYLAYLFVLGGLAYYFWTRKLRERELQHQLQLEQLEAENLKEVDQLKSRFFANISHEFRTPLTLILGQLDSSMERIKDESVKSKLAMAFRNGKRLLQLINQLLDLSKLESGSMQLHALKRDVIPFLKNIYFSFESLAEQRKLRMAFQCDVAALPLFFDEDKLEKVFFNLLSNAIKFTPEGGKIAMMVKKAEPPFSVEITIRDTGIGIPAERLPNIFDRFFQVDSSRTREQEGTGIGLALVKEFVELHGGKVAVRSQEGFGTDFVVALPKGEGSLDEKQASEKHSEFNSMLSPLIESTSQAIVKKKADSTAPQLLIVEDNADVRTYLYEHLAEAGYQILEAVNGEEGVAAAQEHLPDLILTDVMMPRMDGHEFSRCIRSDERTSHIPIIMLTAKAAEEDKIEGLETGVDDYLTKPFSSKELLVRVANLIRLRQQLRDRFSTATIIRPSEVSAISMDRVFLEKAIQAIEEHIGDDQFGVELLSESLHMSVTHLNRKLNALIGQSAGNLIRSMRLQRAADLLSKNAGNVMEIAYKVGFSVPENFSRSFKKQFGCSPLEYQKRMADSHK